MYYTNEQQQQQHKHKAALTDAGRGHDPRPESVRDLLRERLADQLRVG